MSKSLQQHSSKEIHKQLRFRMQTSGLDTIQVQIIRHCGKHKISFTGSPEQVTKAQQILAAWA